MRFIIVAVLIVVASANLAPLFRHEDRVEGEYIIVLKHDGILTDLNDWAGNDVRIHIRRKFRKVLKGFQASITDAAALREVRERADVSFVEEDMVVRSFEDAVTWGQDRVDQRELPLDGLANFAGTGSGVNAYIIDTGIYPTNTYFEGRASVAYNALILGDGIDCNGHGTHCAGTIGSNRYGIAREANLFGVRVLNCIGFGTMGNVLDGMEWVAQNHVAPAVASMSLGGGVSEVLDDAIQGMVDSGIPVATAAGNDNNDACLYSPGRAPEAINVGATELIQSGVDEYDQRASFSNYGECVDIFAPGVDILSTWYGSETATNTISGTSMACPHVAGAACILLGNDPNLTPQEVKQMLVYNATPDLITDVGFESPNKLLYIGTDQTPVSNSNNCL